MGFENWLGRHKKELQEQFIDEIGRTKDFLEYAQKLYDSNDDDSTIKFTTQNKFDCSICAQPFDNDDYDAVIDAINDKPIICKKCKDKVYKDEKN